MVIAMMFINTLVVADVFILLRKRSHAVSLKPILLRHVRNSTSRYQDDSCCM